jgi:hypothetical protein
MKASEFKTNLKAIKNHLKGLTIQFIQPNSVTPYNTLKSFGEAVLTAEVSYNSFCINQVWTADGVIEVNSFNELVQLFKSVRITGISFGTRWIASDLAESLRLDGGLD